MSLTGNSKFCSKSSTGRQNTRRGNAISAQYDLFSRDSASRQLLHFLLGSGYYGRGAADHFFPQQRVVHALHKNVSHDRDKHSDRLDDIWYSAFPAGCRHRRSEQIVQSENMHDFKAIQILVAIAGDTRIPAGRTVMKPSRQIYAIHSIGVLRPSEGATLCDYAILVRLALLVAPIGGKYRDLVAPLRQSIRKRFHFRWWSAKFVKRRVRLRHAQDSHKSRSILRNDLANVAKRNSFSTRCFPRRPMSCAITGFSRSVSMAVASCTASPCGIRYPVFPSSITSGAPPCAPPITGFPQAIASRYTNPNPSPLLGNANISQCA